MHEYQNPVSAADIDRLLARIDRFMTESIPAWREKIEQTRLWAVKTGDPKAVTTCDRYMTRLDEIEARWKGAQNSRL